jgi:pyruvate,orthophosphate dikinase
MSRLFYVGQPLSGQKDEVELRLGRQGTTILQLAARGVAFLPGLMVEVAALREDFEGLFSIIQQQGVPRIEKPLTLKVTLLSDILLESNPSISWLGVGDQNLEETQSRLQEDIARDSSAQLRQAIEVLILNYDADPLNLALPAAILIQYLPVIDQEDSHASGRFQNRNQSSGQITDDNHIQEQYGYLNPEQVSVLKESVSILENWYLDLRQIDFLASEGKIWITEQSELKKSVQARLKLLSDLFRSGQITERVYIKTLTPAELNSVFLPKTDPASTADLICIRGGTTGSPGACCGRVYFTAGNLQTAYRQAKEAGEDRDFILLKESTHAEDFEAIQLSGGVITSKGGYASHAPIVARTLGKASLIYPEIAYFEDYVTIGGKTVVEGQLLTMDIQSHGAPLIYLGQAEIQPALPDSDDLKTLLTEASKNCPEIEVRANAESEREARLAIEYGAAGIGLCRTEHMLLEAGRLEMLRTLLLSEDQQEIAGVRAELGQYLSADFRKLFRIMDGLPLAIRLLDAPLHEFFTAESDSGRLKNRLKQINPMLGFRGCRLGISMPELYEMQIRSILAAALQVYTEERIEVRPEVLIPFVMSEREMAIIRKGSDIAGYKIKGFKRIVSEAARAAGLEKLPFDFPIGAMIEIPSAALSAAKMVHQVEIVSFGTNDLTQTTLGISRDDTASLMDTYQELNIWEGDPFRHLTDPVKQLIDHAVHTGREVRPDLVTGICGEHSASPDTIRYAMNLGLDYVSCAPRSVPGAILAAAQIYFENEA